MLVYQRVGLSWKKEKSWEIHIACRCLRYFQTPPCSSGMIWVENVPSRGPSGDLLFTQDFDAGAEATGLWKLQPGWLKVVKITFHHKQNLGYSRMFSQQLPNLEDLEALLSIPQDVFKEMTKRSLFWVSDAFFTLGPWISHVDVHFFAFEVEVGARFVIVLEGALAGKIKEKEVKLGRGNYLEDEVWIPWDTRETARQTRGMVWMAREWQLWSFWVMLWRIYLYVLLLLLMMIIIIITIIITIIDDHRLS